MPLKILIDESVDYPIAIRLRENGYQVSAIVDESPSEVDEFVLEMAYRTGAYLITEDKDFGDLAIRKRYPHHGILLVRLPDFRPWDKADNVLRVIKENEADLVGRFAVLKHKNLRIKR